MSDLSFPKEKEILFRLFPAVDILPAGNFNLWLMAGHSHWSQIKRKKGALDVKRGKLFSKLAKEITVAVRLGGGDPNFNPRLRTAINTAKAESMPADTIDRALKKGTGELEGVNYEELTYEGYGPAGVSILVETMTDNKNRTVAEVRHVFNKYHGSMGSSGSVAWLFHKKGYFFIEGGDEEQLMEVTLDAGADDILSTADGVEVYCPMDCYDAVEKAITGAEIVTREAKLTYIPDNSTPINNEDEGRRLLKLIEMLEDLEDVQNVYANFEMSEELLNALHPED